MGRMRAVVVAVLVAGFGVWVETPARPACTGGACEVCPAVAKTALLLHQNVYCPAASAPAAPIL